ncbi:MAG TPA: HPr(Ser) kinase/phosphatase [bacterium]|nr:HPr(Ser) kinase/phosphatase [bacterium]
MGKRIHLTDFLEQYGQELQLIHLNTHVELASDIVSAEINRPGLELVGFWDFFEPDRIQIVGNKEIAFLTTHSDQDVDTIISHFFQLKIPCVIFTNGLEPSDTIYRLAEQYQVPLLQSELHSTDLMVKLGEVVGEELAPKLTMHGSMVDVYGIGLLLLGRSGIGKSEVALDLVERGHRLVADDVIRVWRAGGNLLLGSGHELLEHHLELRGVGIIDVRRLFGIRSIRAQKRLEVVINLVEWEDNENYERIGLTEEYMDILGVDIPCVKLPIFPGKSISVIVEVIALNQLMKIYGEYPAREFEDHLIEKLQEQSNLREYLSRDYE